MTTCFCPFTPRLRHRQTSFLWCLFLCLPLALLRLPMRGHFKGKIKHGDFHKSRRFCPSRDTQYFALQSPGVLSSPCGSVWGSAFLVLRLPPPSLTRQVEGKCWVLASRPKEKDPDFPSAFPDHSHHPTPCLWSVPSHAPGDGHQETTALFRQDLAFTSAHFLTVSVFDSCVCTRT